MGTVGGIASRSSSGPSATAIEGGNMTSISFGRRLSGLLASAVIGATLLLGGCGGGGGGGATGISSGDTGQALVSLTDAPGDFLSYTVDVVSLTLTKADGTTVETLPLQTRLDLAQYTDLTEFFTGATVPRGVYVSATMQVDYTNADVEVEDASGHAVQATVVDTGGQPAGLMAMTVKFDAGRRLVVAPGIPALLDLDFNLQASNTVDLTGTPPVVTVNPVLVADVEPDAPKPHRVRGPLASVNTSASTFTLALRPFHLLRGDFGQLTVVTDANTAFEIDQTTYQGAAGLAALAAKPAATATVAEGTLDTTNHRLVATEVYAGSSVAFGTTDVVTGNVIARSGDTLTLRGATLVRTDGTFSFHDTVTVNVASTTKVTGETLVGTPLDKDSISVGQRITALGSLSGTTLDATSGLVRMLITSMAGTVNSAPSGAVLDVALQHIDGRPVSLYNFAGTGAPDADPNHYMIATGSLSLAGIASGTPVRVRGFVQPFGLATAVDDFNAKTLIDVTDGPALLVVDWPSLSVNPFSYDPSYLMVNLTGAGTLHDVFRSGIATTLALTDTPKAQPLDVNHGLFALARNGTVQVYTQFSAYELALQSDLGAGEKARGFASYGTYTDATQTLNSKWMFTVLQ
jgi:Domain of unknown function (DUF4382)